MVAIIQFDEFVNFVKKHDAFEGKLIEWKRLKSQKDWLQTFDKLSGVRGMMWQFEADKVMCV